MARAELGSFFYHFAHPCCIIPAVPTHVQSTKGFPTVYVSSPNPVLLLLSVVLPGWLCGREPASQAGFHAVRKQKPYLQSDPGPIPCSSVSLPLAGFILFPCHPRPSHLINPPASFSSFPHALSILTFAFACDYWKPQAPASREIYS